ncbi:MAG: hypothetical protein A2X64_10840 [Ignavibacteria bacterium GWF2_33_9]|nr:MAG: hypothetical protein A2X64_10840 [Ignavibacteria bacterium GWF2_33_9]
MYKKSWILLFLIFLYSNVTGEILHQNEIYKICLNKILLNNDSNYVSYYITQFHIDTNMNNIIFKNKSNVFEKFSMELSLNFIKLNSSTNKHINNLDKFNNNKFIMLDSDTILKYFYIQNKKGWESFYKDFNYGPIIYLSQIGFNNKGNKAGCFVHVLHNYNCEIYSCYLVKCKGNWILKVFKLIASC